MSLRFGACSFTAKGWETAFYPRAVPRPRWLEYYSTQFDAVEIDSSFYGVPSRELMSWWNEITPDGFAFTFKAPRSITHSGFSSAHLDELIPFLEAVQPLEHKVAALLFQFPYFRRSEMSGPGAFLEAAGRLMDALPQGCPAVIEIRNRSWVTDELLGPLLSRNYSLALIDHPYTGSAGAWSRMLGCYLDSFPLIYVRLLGDRHAIEEKTTVWYRVVEDRSADLEQWADLLNDYVAPGTKRGLVFANNHYEGYAAETIRRLRNLLDPH